MLGLSFCPNSGNGASGNSPQRQAHQHKTNGTGFATRPVCRYPIGKPHYGFFFFPPNSPPNWFATPAVPLPPAAPAKPARLPTDPPAQVSSDFIKLAVAPPMSGVNCGFAVVPWICSGTLTPPFLQLAPAPNNFPAAPPTAPPSAPPAAPSMELFTVATSLKSIVFFESSVPPPTTDPSVGTTRLKLSARKPVGAMCTSEVIFSMSKSFPDLIPASDATPDIFCPRSK